MVKVQLNNKSSQFYFAYFLYFLSNFFAIELKNHFCDHWTFTNRTSFLICFDFEPFKYSNLWDISHTRLFSIFSFKKNFKKISIILTIRDILSRRNESISRKKLSFWLPWWPLCPQTFRTVPPMFCQTRYVDRRWSVLTKSPSQCKNKSGGSTRWRTSG